MLMLGGRLSVRELLRSTRRSPLVEAHRGGAGGQRLTLEVLQRSHDQGAHLLEVDLQFTADRVGVVQHHFGTPDGHLVSDLPVDELMKSLPESLTFDEVLNFAKESGAYLSVDLKTGHGRARWWVDEVARLSSDHRVEDQILVLSWDHRMLRELRDQAPAIAQRALMKGNLTCFPAYLEATDVEAVSLSYDLIEVQDVEGAHARGVAVAMAEMWCMDVSRAHRVGADLVSWGDVPALVASLAHEFRDA
jgi:glycerophosphoryl diester phosphodiesterase